MLPGLPWSAEKIAPRVGRAERHHRPEVTVPNSHILHRRFAIHRRGDGGNEVTLHIVASLEVMPT